MPGPSLARLVPQSSTAALNHSNSQRLADTLQFEGSPAANRSKSSDDHSTVQAGESTIRDVPMPAAPQSETWKLDLPSTPAVKLLQAANRSQLEELYFSKFHPHWPILHHQTFQNSAQIPTLSIAVLLAGLWMVGDPRARDEAKLYHDTILNGLDRKLVKAPLPHAFSIRISL
ncbi:hypothetical protein N7466_002567 [Penicillium verhagenii]|uniref:uncharacterized protein n=1 Tax=Penicillium verhagenii TaxID=1562060 RepID=UPI0025458BFA|nr:uncharacterized protein N7466_002567 [Penicillium verhagenii]KAJ5939433.1 hypothetical protein N7466_002567 [Penicillium verhagenii]